jgi:hypothetical protein
LLLDDGAAQDIPEDVDLLGQKVALRGHASP